LTQQSTAKMVYSASWRIFTFILILAFPNQSGANSLTKECKNSVFSSSPSVICPGPDDEEHSIFCCQKKGVDGEETPYCCNYPDSVEVLPTPQPAKIVRGLAKIIGVALGVIAFIVLACLICCCCCPFCFLAKRRQRGHIIRQNNPPGSTPQGVPMAQSGQVPYPQQGGPHPPPQNASQYYANETSQGYQGQQGGAYPAGYHQPHSTMDQPPPYPGHPADTAGPAGAEYGKPPAYNPNAAPPL